jgi:hypothetical protein
MKACAATSWLSEDCLRTEPDITAKMLVRPLYEQFPTSIRPVPNYVLYSAACSCGATTGFSGGLDDRRRGVGGSISAISRQRPSARSMRLMPLMKRTGSKT